MAQDTERKLQDQNIRNQVIPEIKSIRQYSRKHGRVGQGEIDKNSLNIESIDI